MPAILFFTAVATSLQASSFDSIYAFGDSLSDAGNIYTATLGTIPGTPYVNGHFTNGQVWVQDLSASLGLGSLNPSLQGGNDFAYGGALSGTISGIHTAGPTDLTGSTGQIAQFEALHPTADPNALYTIWIGSNDLLDIAQSGVTGAAATAAAGAVLSNIDSAIGSLASEGAKNFLILTVPDLGKTPGVIAAGAAAQAAASGLSASFDMALAGALPGGLNISVLNTYSLLDGIIANPTPYGFTNVTQPCVTGAVNYVGGTACSSTVAGQDQYLFWDQLHPTAAGHALLGQAAFALVSTPEPGTLMLIGLGVAGVCFYKRRL